MTEYLVIFSPLIIKIIFDTSELNSEAEDIGICTIKTDSSRDKLSYGKNKLIEKWNARKNG